MNALFEKIDTYIDYNNHYTVRKALTTLGREFSIAISHKDRKYAETVIDAVRQVHDKLSSMYRESEQWGETMGYFQKSLAKQMRDFLSYLINKLDNNLG